MRGDCARVAHVAKHPSIVVLLRRALKFLHTMGAAGLIGAMTALVILSSVAPPPQAIAGYAAVRGAMGAVATWMFLPSLAVTLIAGLLAIAVNRAYHNAGWAWLKLLTGLSMFEGGIQGIQGPIQEQAEQSARALAGHLDPATLAGAIGSERATLWVLLAVATANVVLGIWRPRLLRLPD